MFLSIRRYVSFLLPLSFFLFVSLHLALFSSIFASEIFRETQRSGYLVYLLCIPYIDCVQFIYLDVSSFMSHAGQKLRKMYKQTHTQNETKKKKQFKGKIICFVRCLFMKRIRTCWQNPCCC